MIGGELQLRVRHGDADSGLKTGNHAEVVGLVRRSEFKLKWQPEVRRIIGDKFAADYTYDLVGQSIELNAPADDGAISAKAALPEAIT